MKAVLFCASWLAIAFVSCEVCWGQGRSGGSRPSGAGLNTGAARSAAGAAASRAAASRPNMPRPVSPGQNMSRPSLPNLGASAPGPNGPNLGQAAPQMPVNRPAPSRPNLPSGGLTPGTRPALPPTANSRPNLPATLPSLPGGGNSIAGSLPGSLPNNSLPNLGNRPLPGNLPGAINRPGISERPGLTERPSLPTTRPGQPEGRPGLPENRPNFSDRLGSVQRPGISTLPGSVTRPTPGDLGDFLGMDRPLRPGQSPAVPLPERPGIGDRPGLADRPSIPNRPGTGDRPNLSDRTRWPDNTVINQRPQWANIDRSVNVTINNRWNAALVNPSQRGWWAPPAARIGFWAGWATGVRTGWGVANRRNIWFTPIWWNRHPFPIGGWHFHFWRVRFPVRHWWIGPTWVQTTGWFTWTAPPQVWAQPVYYDYGTQGNVVFRDSNVYIGGDRVCSTEEFAVSAMNLATVSAPESEEQAAMAEWLPLGTFAVSTNEKDLEPSHVVQMAVSREGIVSGTLFNIETEQSQAIQGQVDRETQRVAFRIGESETIVAETGLYNLTQEEAPLLIHFGTERSENYLLIRLEYDSTDEEDVQ